jgi:hypothetical protein
VDEMGRACIKHGREDKCMQIFGRKPVKIKNTWKTRSSEDNIRIDLREIVWDGMDWISWLRIWASGCLLRHGNEVSGATKGGEYLDSLNHY